MKKKLAAVLAAAILSSANFASAEDVELDGAANAPTEINHPNSIYYPHLDFYNMTSRGDRIILPHFGTYQQTTEYTCGPAADLMVLHYYGNYDFSEMELAKEVNYPRLKSRACPYPNRLYGSRSSNAKAPSQVRHRRAVDRRPFNSKVSSRQYPKVVIRSICKCKPTNGSLDFECLSQTR